jgi:DNA-binding SARP family transcriptional activator
VIRLRLLGETAIDVDGTPVGPESQVLFAVLLVLALERGKRIARTALHRLLWPATDDDSGRHNLRQVLYKLRQLGAPVDATQSSVMIPTADVTGELVELLSGEAAIGARIATGRRVGELLPGYAPAFSSPFADWVDEQRALLQAQLRRSLLGAMAEARGHGAWRDVEAVAREVLRFDALNEEATLALAEATALAGAKAQAIGIIDRYLDEVGGHPADLRLPATVLRRRIAERFPTHKYVNAADNCFVGRAREIAELLATWRRAKDRRGGAVLLWGEPGIGKTRLAHELGKVAVLQGAQVQRVASRSWDVQRPLGAIVDIVPPLRELPGAAGIDPRCNEYLDRLTKHDPTRPLADLPDPATLHRQVRQAVFDLIDALLAEAPLVLVFEDVQWLDAASWEVLAELLRLARTRRLLLVLTSRVATPTQMPESEDWEALLRLRLDGIGDAATNELLDAITREGGKYVDPDYREWCVPLANGNPLHVQEIALQWLEKGSVREAPGSLRAMIEARINRLSSSGRLLLQLCALTGSHFRLEWYSLSKLFSSRDVLLASDELADSHLTLRSADALTIRHPIVGEAAIAKLSPTARSALYRTIAVVLTSLPQDELSVELMWEAARSWNNAGYDERALSLVERCANHLMHVGLPLDACRLFDLGFGIAQTASAQSRILNGKVLALAQADLWEQVIAALQDYDTRETPQRASPSGAAVLRLLEARWRQNEDVSPLIMDSCSLATSDFYDATSRLRAATLALVLSDNRDGVLAEYEACEDTILRLLTSPHAKGTERYRHMMLRHWSHGELGDSAIAARRMLIAYEYSEQPFDCLLFRQAAFAFRFAGAVDEARSTLISALDCSLAESLYADVFQCYLALAQLAMYRQDMEEANRWCDFALSLGDLQQNPLAMHSLSLTVSQLAALRNDAALAERTAAALGDPLAPDNNVRRKLARLTAHMRARLITAAHLTADDRILLGELVPLLSAHQHRGSVDMPVAAYARALRLDGQREAASNQVEAYIRTRRLERCPLHLDLEMVRRELVF